MPRNGREYQKKKNKKKTMNNSGAGVYVDDKTKNATRKIYIDVEKVEGREKTPNEKHEEHTKAYT